MRQTDTGTFVKTVPYISFWGGASYSTAWRDVIVHTESRCSDIILHYRLSAPVTAEDLNAGLLIKHNEQHASELIEKKAKHEYGGQLWEIEKFRSDKIEKWVYMKDLDAHRRQYLIDLKEKLESIRIETRFDRPASRIKRGIERMKQIKKMPYVSGILAMLGVIAASIITLFAGLIISDLIS